MSKNDSVMLQRDTLPIQVLNKLMDWIMDGTLKMGKSWNTEELARQLGVSRMPMREALKSLEKMGLAESVPYVGMRLVSLQQEDILQIYLMRQLLEPLAAGEACRKITKAQIDELENIQEEYIRDFGRKGIRCRKNCIFKTENSILLFIPHAEWTEFVE